MDQKLVTKWRDILAKLLEKADDAATEPDLNVRRGVARSLQEFIIDNPPFVADEPESAVFREMDEIATKAHDALLLSVIEDRVAAIAARSVELAGLEKKIAVQTAANDKEAKSIRLEKATAVVSSITSAVSSIKALKAQLEEAPGSEEDLTALVRQLGRAVESLQALRTAVEATG